MSESDEFQIQRTMAKSLESVTLRLWGQWAGKATRPRWRCNKHPIHEFVDTVESVANRENEVGTGCPRCALLLERPVVPFEEFAESAIAVEKARVKSEEKARNAARKASFNRLQAS